MKIKMLPNWCKKLGLAIFLLSLITSVTYTVNRESFCDGWNAGRNSNISDNSIKNSSKPIKETQNLEPLVIEKSMGSKSLHVFDIITLLGMIIYMLSKEKVEDDYINKLRLESYQLNSLLGLILALGLFAFSGNLEFSLDSFITIFLMSYLIIFAIKKRIY